MTRPTQKPPKTPRPTAKAKSEGRGAIAQGRKAKAAGQSAVIVERNNSAPINTGSGDIYQTIVQQSAQPGATPCDLRQGYLAWLSLRANELPLLDGGSGRQAQLASVYTALLTQGRERGEAQTPALAPSELVPGERETARQSALEALASETARAFGCRQRCSTGRARRIVGLPSRPRALRLPRWGPTRRPVRQPRFPCYVACRPCFLSPPSVAPYSK